MTPRKTPAAKTLPAASGNRGKEKPKRAPIPPSVHGPRPQKLPPAPAFGWVADARLLSLDELDTIKMLMTSKPGHEDRQLTLLMMGYTAVAIARRADPELYPWSIAPWIPVNEMIGSADEDTPGEEELAVLQEEALERGEPMPDPA